MSTFDDHERRLVTLETELPLLRAEAVATRTLAAGAHQDVADVRTLLRAHTSVLNALRETQLDHYNEHKADAAELKADMRELKTDMTGVKADIHGLKTDVNGLKTDMTRVKADIHGLKTDVNRLKTDMSEVKAGMTRIERLLEGAARP